MILLTAAGVRVGWPAMAGLPGAQVDRMGPDPLPGSSEPGVDRETLQAQLVVPATVSSLHSLALGWPIPRWAVGAQPEDESPRHHAARHEAGAGDEQAGRDEHDAQAPQAAGPCRVDGGVSSTCRHSYRTITRWLHDGQQRVALRELAMHRRVLVLQPLAGDVAWAQPWRLLCAHLLWVSVQGVGQVRDLTARWWPALDVPPFGQARAWLSWRCHREQTDQGVRLQFSRAHQPGAPLIRLSDEAPGRAGSASCQAILHLPESRRLLALLGTQWSLQMVLMPAGVATGGSAP